MGDLNSKHALYCFWTGNNEMSPQRKRCLELLSYTEADIVLITDKNLHEYVKYDPIHEAYPYLSETHRADYLRTYFMHFIGGGYSDIKVPGGSWSSAFEEIETSDDIYCVGYREINAGSVEPYVPQIVQDNWMKILGNGAYIFKADTEFTREWYGSCKKLLDDSIEQLKKYPATHPRQTCSGIHGVGQMPGYEYPFRWGQLLSEIFHPICYKHRNKLSKNLPRPDLCNYR